MKDDLIALLELQKLDSSLAKLQNDYSGLDRGEQEKLALELAQKSAQESQAALHSASGELKDSELELKALETKRAEVERKLYGGTVRNPKELQAMQDEVEMLARQRTKLDERILVLMETVEARKQEAATGHSAQTHAASSSKKKQAEYREIAERMVAEARAVAAERVAAAKRLKPQLLKQYEALKTARGGLAVVPLIDGQTCGGCRMALSSSFVEAAKFATSITICDNCGRIVVAP